MIRNNKSPIKWLISFIKSNLSLLMIHNNRILLGNKWLLNSQLHLTNQQRRHLKIPLKCFFLFLLLQIQFLFFQFLSFLLLLKIILFILFFIFCFVLLILFAIYCLWILLTYFVCLIGLLVCWLCWLCWGAWIYVKFFWTVKTKQLINYSFVFLFWIQFITWWIIFIVYFF